MAGAIPLHRLREESHLGLFLHRIDEMDREALSSIESHRDDHFNFFFQEGGRSIVMVDFREILFEGCGIFCVLPGQVHRPVLTAGSTGWFMATDMISLNDSHRKVCEEYVSNGDPIALNGQQAGQLGKCMRLLHDLWNEADELHFYPSVLRSMLDVCLGIFAGIFQESLQKDPSVHLRPVVITREFRRSLRENFKNIKTPSAYASILNITPSYLNEVVKQTTGSSVSHWIHQEVMMEAKRLLYFTSLDVKEIAFQVGYEDHTYFSRLFRKVVQCAPGHFRSQYRK